MQAKSRIPRPDETAAPGGGMKGLAGSGWVGSTFLRREARDAMLSHHKRGHITRDHHARFVPRSYVRISLVCDFETHLNRQYLQQKPDQLSSQVAETTQHRGLARNRRRASQRKHQGNVIYNPLSVLQTSTTDASVTASAGVPSPGSRSLPGLHSESFLCPPNAKRDVAPNIFGRFVANLCSSGAQGFRREGLVKRLARRCRGPGRQRVVMLHIAGWVDAQIYIYADSV